jgi:hypothetical protein
VTATLDDKRVVLCGSMSSLGTLQTVYRELSDAGIDAVLPTEDDFDERSTIDEVNKAKRAASLRHFDCIKDQRTTAVLVVNVDKNGRHDYIGPNAFAEIAVAVSEGRSVYLLQGVPPQYRDELDAWGVQSLYGDLAKLKWAWDTSTAHEHAQMLTAH